MNSIGERILEIQRYYFGDKRGSKANFAKAIGENSNTVSNWFGRKDGIGDAVINKILSAFPEVDKGWLVGGNGEMLTATTINKSAPVSVKKETRPRIPYDAAAGTLTEAVDGVAEYQCEQLPVISAFPKYDFTIRITGRSMEPEFYSGDEVACLRVNEKQFLQWGRVHVLDTTQGIVIKRIYEYGESILCRSYNPEYPDFSIPKKDIRSYNLVVGSLRL